MLVGLATTLVALMCLVATAEAAAPAIELRTEIADTAEPGDELFAKIFVENSGNAPMSGTLMVTVTLPAELTVAENALPPGAQLRGEPSGSCTNTEHSVTCEVVGSTMRPDAKENVFLPLRVADDATGELVPTIEVSGGGAADPVMRQEPIVLGPPEPFEVRSFTAAVEDANGVDDLQAGAAPGTAANVFQLPTHAAEVFPGRFFGYKIWEFQLVNAVTEHPRNVIVHTPAGMTANFGATPVRCTSIQLATQSENGQLPKCPAESQIGVAKVGSFVEPVYSMVPPPGVPAEFGFSVAAVPILIDARLRPDDFGVDLVARNTSTSIPVSEVDVALWGVPADPSHDSSRDVCIQAENGNSIAVEPDGTCASRAPRKAFLRLPTSCTGPLHWRFEVDSYEHPGVYKSSETTTPAQVGCNQLEFTPSFEAKPSTNLGASPSGLEVNLHLPQNEDPDGTAEAQLKNLRMELPPGLVVNSAGADGLGACSPTQIGLLTPVGQVPAHFNGDAPACPDASKIGSVLVNTPAIDHPLPGTVYLAQQDQNPFGSLVALYLVVDDPQSGVIVKVPVKTELNQVTGQITTFVEESPQLPFEDFSVELDKGAHAPLRTPVSCGQFTAKSDWTPWTSPEGQDAHPTASFGIEKGAGGGGCVSTESAAPAQTSFEAGTLDPKAGAYSPFVLKLTRQDGSQNITGIDTTLPKGLVGRLVGTSYCPEAALQQAAHKSGRAEQASPSCPALSELGPVNVAAGVGPAPLHVQGHAYLTGPYKGAPLGLAVVMPAAAGPFDLGTVVVRSQLQVNPVTAQVRAVSDPIPHILQGVPLEVRQVEVRLDRPQFTLNPTSCDPMQVTGVAALLNGQSTLSNHFQVGGCANLSFKPKLGLRLKGKQNRGGNPAITATVMMPSGAANIAFASVALPHSEFLDQGHIGTICTRVQYAEGGGGGERCPAASVYGHATAYSPLLDQPLSGPVYLRSSDNKLPDLVASLSGQIHIDLDGRIDSIHGGIRTTFESVPDAPVSKFVLQMPGGHKGLLENSTNICRGTHRATARFEGQNGAIAASRPKLRVSCRKGRKGHRGHHGHRKHGR
ncbi:MAG TPA: hypothetical protein VFN85_01405 [Solirubrobacterales bacterium]|nr:hypothetical protein [Solirubrobacterales bacterium]